MQLIYFMYVSTLLLSSDTADPITDGCEPPRGCWELNSGPLEEQLVLLTAEPSIPPPYGVSLNKKTMTITYPVNE